MKEVSKGYIFETVFLLETNKPLIDTQSPKTAPPAPPKTPHCVARRLNQRESDRPILANDRRILPGQRCRVRVERVTPGAIYVEYLGLVQLRVEEGVYIDPELRELFEILICSGRSILLEGPQGSGKTTIARALAKSLGLRFVFFNCAICFEPSDFAGALQLRVDDQGRARTEWLATEVLEAVVEATQHPEQRYLIFLDELNRCRSYALNGIMSAIDASRCLFDPRQNRYIPIPDNVQWIAAVNMGKQFSGTYKLDLAQLDRFAILKMTWPPEDEEIRILRRQYPSIKSKHVRTLVCIANTLRKDPSILTDLSMRATDEACLILSYPSHLRALSPQTLIKVLHTCFCNRLPGALDEPGSEAAFAAAIIERSVLLKNA